MGTPKKGWRGGTRVWKENHPRHNFKNTRQISQGKKKFQGQNSLAVVRSWPRGQQRDARLALEARVWTFYQCFTKRQTILRWGFTYITINTLNSSTHHHLYSTVISLVLGTILILDPEKDPMLRSIYTDWHNVTCLEHLADSFSSNLHMFDFKADLHYLLKAFKHKVTWSMNVIDYMEDTGPKQRQQFLGCWSLSDL